MDLNERLADKINAIPNLPYPCIINFLNDNEGLALYPVVGSSTKSADWAGNLTKVINYEVQIRGSSKQAPVLNGALWRIASMLDSLETLDSKDNSYIFKKLNITNEPSLTDADTNGHLQYSLGFNVQIFQTKEMLENGRR